MRTWRTKEKCEDCPFATKGPGLELRKSLRAGRWQEILAGLLKQEHFFCHKTTEDTGNGSNLVCAGSIEWQDKHGTSSQFMRVCETLDYFARKKKQWPILGLNKERRKHGKDLN